MDYLFHFDANYCSEEDSDYVPSDTSTGSDSSGFSASGCSDSDSMSDVTPVTPVSPVACNTNKNKEKTATNSIHTKVSDVKEVSIKNIKKPKNANSNTKIERPTRTRRVPSRYQS